MAEIQRAAPAARRQALLFVVVGTLAGSLFIVGFERYSKPLRDWILADPEQLGHRLRSVFLVSAASLSAPLFGFAVYLWSFGGKVLRARQFPPPGYRLIRDISVLHEQGALSRGRGFKILAVCLSLAGVLLWFLSWRLASTILNLLYNK